MVWLVLALASVILAGVAAAIEERVKDKHGQRRKWAAYSAR
jgi:hypothetical protein